MGWPKTAIILLTLLFFFWLLERWNRRRQGQKIGLSASGPATHCEVPVEIPPAECEAPPKKISKGQLEACNAFAKALGRSVRWNYRPDWLKNPLTGRNLELDCYDEVEKIGLEHQSNLHYQYTPHFHRTPQRFIDSIQRDIYKQERCQQLGIYLIETHDQLPKGSIASYVTDHINQCRRLRAECQRDPR